MVNNTGLHRHALKYRVFADIPKRSHNQKMHFRVRSKLLCGVVILFVSTHVACAAGVPPSPKSSPQSSPKPSASSSSSLLSPADKQKQRKKRIAYLRALESKGQIRTANCPEIANYFLSANGLPALGQNEPVKGTRGDLNRKGETHDPPEFLDEIHFKKPDVSVRIVAEKKDSDRWTLTLDRVIGITQKSKRGKKSDIMHTRTIYSFQKTSSDQHSECSLQTIDFLFQTEKTSYRLKDSYRAEDCEDLLDRGNKGGALRSKSIPRIGLVTLRKDCAMGIHYFGDEQKVGDVHGPTQLRRIVDIMS
jgi:hypothetical protein